MRMGKEREGWWWWWWGWWGCYSSKSFFDIKERERDKGKLWYEWWLAFCVCVAAVSAKKDEQQLIFFEGSSFGFGWVVCVICGVLLFSSLSWYSNSVTHFMHWNFVLVSCRGHSHVRFFLPGRATDFFRSLWLISSDSLTLFYNFPLPFLVIFFCLFLLTLSCNPVWLVSPIFIARKRRRRTFQGLVRILLCFCWDLFLSLHIPLLYLSILFARYSLLHYYIKGLKVFNFF